ncbi:uncharacterized protein LOC135819590 [Sycon ciliatum]|uniref:uncharacterized protein LOC135819590 n=1 Tax=Sycon ciliatum TaxID=27933 RepID=UPI0031F6EFA3
MSQIVRRGERRLRNEADQLRKDPPLGCTAGPIARDLYCWNARIMGPDGSPYEGGMFLLRLTFPDEYPFKPPTGRFITRIFLPILTEGGTICDYCPNTQLSTERWRPACKIKEILESIRSVMSNPYDCDSHPLVSSLHQTDRPLFVKTAQEWTRMYAMGADIDPAHKLGVPIIRVLLLGEADVGKTSLACSLAQKRMPQRQTSTSTLGVDMSTIVIHGDDGDARQVTSADAESEQALMRQLASLIEQGSVHDERSTFSNSESTSSETPSARHSRALASRGPKRTFMDKVMQRLSLSASKNSPSAKSPSEPSTLPPDVLKSITEKVTSTKYVTEMSELIAREQLTVMRVWDNAGQDCYRVLHHITFGAYRTSYVIVYNAQCPVTEVAEPSNVRMQGECRPCSSALPGQPGLTYIHDALETIHQNVPDDSDVRVFIAGCHIDERQRSDVDLLLAELDSERDEIIRSVACEPFSYLLRKEDIFFIDNTRSGLGGAEDEQLVALRRQLCMESEQNQAIPTARLLETLSFMEVSSHPELRTPWITRDEAEELVRRINSAHAHQVDTSAALSFQHSIGTALHYPESSALRDKLIVNVPNVMKLAAALIQPCLTRADLVGAMSLADIHQLKQGFVSDHVATCLWKKFCPHLYPAMAERENRVFFYDLMNSFHILCHVGEMRTENNDDSVVGDAVVKEMFWMPAAAERAELPITHGAVSPEIILSSDNGAHLPHSTFLRIGNECLSRYNARHRRDDGKTDDTLWMNTSLAKCSMRLPVNGHEWLILRYMKCGISIRVEANSNRYKFRDGDGVPILSQIHGWVKDVLALAHKKIRLKEYIRCECGVMNAHALCTLHGREACTSSSVAPAIATSAATSGTRGGCFHTVSLLHLGDVPMCPIAFSEHRTAPQRVSQEALRYWKSWVQDPDTYVIMDLGSVAAAPSAAARGPPAAADPYASARAGLPAPAASAAAAFPELAECAAPVEAPDDLLDWKYRDKTMRQVDRFDLAQGLKKELDDDQRVLFAHRAVKLNDIEYVGQFEVILVNLIREHDFGEPSLTNVRGVLEYLARADREWTCGELLDMLWDVGHRQRNRLKKIFSRVHFLSD